ncbi:MAG TPA: formate dehydrogenase accessory sulfurtransferase FdhD [Abditibacteriaceae bacterium]|jgi:FdhD protein
MSEIVSHHVTQWKSGGISCVDDALVVEEPLEIRVGTRRFSATMRTPQSDETDLDLARGLLFSEGVIETHDDIASIKICETGESEQRNVVSVQLRRAPATFERWDRNLISNSSCGLCGKSSVESLGQRIEPLPSGGEITAENLLHLPAEMRKQQRLFEQTGGLHAAALFRCDGELFVCREDIGRHNATDKVLGWALREGIVPAREPMVLLCSGRASFEIVQKALVARIAVVASVSAASGLAVELAQSYNATLVGFLRARSFNIYTGATRIGTVESEGNGEL